MKNILTIIALTITVLLCNCASLIATKEQNISITSQPGKAHVTITTVESNWWGSEELNQYGTTPCTVPLERNPSGYAVSIKLDGYKEATTSIHNGSFRKNYWMYAIGNLCFTWGIGIVVDILGGAAYDMKPDNIEVSLETAMLPGNREIQYACLSYYAKNICVDKEKLLLEPEYATH